MTGRTFIIKSLTWFLIIGFIIAANSTHAQDKPLKHVVKELDNYYSISLRYDISIEELKKANPGIEHPKPGDVIVIPQPSGHQEEPVVADCQKRINDKSAVYRVALMIPLYLEQVADSIWKESLDPAKINSLSPFRFIQYYHGFMAAADSLKQKGLNVEIRVYDVDQTSSKAYKLIHDPELKEMDMIFGPFFKSTFSIVADFASENKIPIINPLSSRDDILTGNPFVFKLLPSVESQSALLAELVYREFSDHNILLYIANKYQDQALISDIKQKIEQNDLTGRRIVHVVDYAADTSQGFYTHASLIKPNLVIIYAENEVLPAALLSKLSALNPEYRITVIGLPEWEKFTNIESLYLMALNAIIFSSSYADEGSEPVKAFTKAYRAEYSDEPMSLAYSGFDAAYFFMSALLNYGHDFTQCLGEIRTKLIQNQYHFEKRENGGYDNVNWNVLQYYDYNLIKKSF